MNPFLFLMPKTKLPLKLSLFFSDAYFFINPGLLIPKTEPQTTNDHPLLRQVLEDFPFESKFGDDFGSSSAETEFRCQVKSELDDSLSEAVKMSPVISLAVEQVKKDIDTTCQILRISPGIWEIFTIRPKLHSSCSQARS